MASYHSTLHDDAVQATHDLSELFSYAKFGFQ